MISSIALVKMNRTFFQYEVGQVQEPSIQGLYGQTSSKLSTAESTKARGNDH